MQAVIAHASEADALGSVKHVRKVTDLPYVFLDLMFALYDATMPARAVHFSRHNGS
jgi:hypothetical protein